MRHTRALLLSGVLGIAVAVCLLRYDAHKLENLGIELTQVYRACSHYIRDHDGRLPTSIDELVHQNYVRSVTKDGQEVFLGPPARKGEFLPVYDRNLIRVERFSIEVRGNIKEFEVKGNRAYKPGRQEAVAIVIPPRRALMDLSLELTAKTILGTEQLQLKDD